LRKFRDFQYSCSKGKSQINLKVDIKQPQGELEFLNQSVAFEIMTIRFLSENFYFVNHNLREPIVLLLRPDLIDVNGKLPIE